MMGKNDEEIDEAFHEEEEEEEEENEEEDRPAPARTAPPAPKRSKKANGGSDETPEEKFNRLIREANGEDGKGTLFSHYVIDVTEDGAPAGSYMGRDCKFEFEGGERETSPSFAGFAQRVSEKSWDGTTRNYNWAMRNQNGASVGRGKLPLSANLKRQAAFAAELVAIRERAMQQQPRAVAAPDPISEARRIREEEDARYEERRRRRREEEDREEEERRQRRNGTAAPAGDAGESAIAALARRMDEEARVRAEDDRRRMERDREDDRRRMDEQNRATQATLGALAEAVKVIADSASKPPAPMAPPAPKPFAELPPAPRGHEYVIVDGQAVCRPIAAPPPVKTDDSEEQEYTGMFSQLKRVKRLVDEGSRFFGDSGKGERGSTTTDDDPPAVSKKPYEEIPDGKGGVAYRIVPDPETGLMSTDPEKIIAANGDIILREIKNLAGSALEAWKNSKLPPSQQQAPKAAQQMGPVDTSILDRD